jgi:hypothetical protein
MSPEDFQAWADDKREEIQQAGEDLSDQRKQREGDQEN